MFKKLLMPLATLALTASLAHPALAREGDTEACAGKADGDECTRADGDPGTCQPDESDADVLTCDDDAAASDDDGSGGCSSSGAGAGSTPGFPIALAALGMAAALRRARQKGR